MAQMTRYVSLTGSHTPPFTNWATAATDIQAAVDAAGLLDTVLVTNGIYQTGGRVVAMNLLTNRVVIDKPIPVSSVNGPAVTIIVGAKDPLITNGNSAVRCIWLSSGASISGFTLTNGATRWTSYDDGYGGGIFSETGGMVSNCVLSGNSAGSVGGGVSRGTLHNCTISGNSAAGGGGAYYATLNNCMLSGNSASGSGGGANNGTLNNCMLSGNSAGGNGGGTFAVTLDNCALSGNSAKYGGGGAANGTLNNCMLSSNSADYGGGTYFSSLNNCTVSGNSAVKYGGGVTEAGLNNCIVYFNSAPTGSNHRASSFTNSCTTPLPASGTGNISADPQFQNLAAGNLRLRATSPCRDTGNNALAQGATDLDGNTRTNGAAVDMGAFEFSNTDNDNDGLPDWWEILYGLNPAASNAVNANADADGYTDLDEYIADTNPTNPASFFPCIALANPPPEAMSLVISNTSAGRVYFVLGATNLLAPQAWTLIPPELPGTGTNLVLTTPATNGFRALRTGVRLP